MPAAAADEVAWRMCLCVCVSVGHTREPAKTAEPIKMSFRGLTLAGRRMHVLNGGQHRMNLFSAVRGNNWAMQPFAK